MIPAWLRRFAHNRLDWHLDVEVLDFDGCSVVGRCRRCGRRLLQDSQGNWFSSWLQFGDGEAHK